MIRALALMLALPAVLSAALAPPAQAQTVVLVRHAEKADGGRDPELSAAGQARAQALAQALEGARVTQVLATPLKRTQATAAPAARAAGVPVTPVPLDGGAAAHVRRVADLARRAPADATVLIVGHSNTVPDIARALGDAAARPMTECEYDHLFVLQLGQPAPKALPKALHARYGVPTDPC